MEDGIICRSTKTIHLCMSVEGAIRQGVRKLNGLFEDEHGRPFTGKYCMELLKKYRFEGKRVIPMGDCDNFDYQTGCRGHGKMSIVHDWYFEQGNG